ncbi:hypothetical protein PoB_005583800 [Plakobranchus ocellatus]|uniref:Uncharacterized protein n=1 Tax=Plakobranchus ocellatus TaxID=259542 RepID=A0AAV4CBU0_9GAST|nr:hypothetical protein PoB_005583800 [Plakobranchus ocellatus]
MEKVLNYPLSPVPWSLSSPDGLPLKTNKATLLHKLENTFNCFESQDFSRQPNTAYIIHGNALLPCLSSDPDIFRELAKQAFRSLPQTASAVHFVTDTYKTDSIKSCQCLRRDASTAKSYVLQGSATKVPKNFKEFLSNDGNKKGLISFLCAEWASDAYAHLLMNKEFFFVNEEMCELLTGNQGSVNSIPVPDLYSSHEEADSRIILHCMYASQQPTTERVIVRPPDSDVFLLPLSLSDAINKPLIFDTGSGNNRRQLNITDLAATMSKRLCDAIIGLQAFTGCNSTSCFAGKGKLKALKMLQGDQDLQETFSRFGTLETISGQDMQVIETFVCQLYGKPSHIRVRYDKKSDNVSRARKVFFQIQRE